jgi:hypothetical protein
MNFIIKNGTIGGSHGHKTLGTAQTINLAMLIATNVFKK